MPRRIPRYRYIYNVYGYSIHSQIALPCPENKSNNLLPKIELVEGSPLFFKRALRFGGVLAERDKISERVDIVDGSIYLRWYEQFEFLIVAGANRICWHALHGSTSESLYWHLLGPVLSYAMLKHGIEPLHATVLDVDGKGVALLGESGAGKSTLAAAFVKAGYKLLTDDVLVLRRENGCWLAYPGLPRLKLYEDMARYIFGDVFGVVMNPWTTKRILPLPPDSHQSKPLPLCALYVISTPSRHARGVLARRCIGKGALIHLLRHTYNAMVTNSPRLQRQLLFCRALAKETPVRFLSYPHHQEILGAVVSKITNDIGNSTVMASSRIPSPASQLQHPAHASTK